jgi:hypothetical protein
LREKVGAVHKIVTYIFYAIILVLVVTHAPGFAAGVTSVGGQATKETSLLTGASSATSAA